jgi:6-phosphofructokinase 1
MENPVFDIDNLGERSIPSPLLDTGTRFSRGFVSDARRMLYHLWVDDGRMPDSSATLEVAGPREKLYFQPDRIRTAIVTCGGLCPGINDVIRSIVMESWYHYGCKNIIGIRYGYNGLHPEKNYEPIELTPERVEDIHMDGGTILSSSRGGTENMELLVDTLQRMEVSILYTIGGDGTLKGAHAIHEGARKRGYTLAVVGVPKTIDNDISFIQRSFGFETAFSQAVSAIRSAHVEAKGAPNGVGLVKLMGRHSGFIAANATLAMNDVNYVFIPEVPFCLEGEKGFLKHLEERLRRRQHAVICLAEGAGQDLMRNDDSEIMRDASGNVKLQDIGIYMREKINDFFDKRGMEVNVKYIDPSYIIRSSPAVPTDSVYCALLGQHAVHAGMAGKTDLVIGQWNNIYTHVPIEVAVSKRKKVNPDSSFWHSVMEATGQPDFVDCDEDK